MNDVSFQIRQGENVAFVGRSGAGKSSTIHLIERFFDPNAGQVHLDGQDIRQEAVRNHRARLALVEQEPDLFPGSVKFNIGLGARPGTSASDEDIQRVAKECELHDFIMSLPEGYNTEVGSQGSKLSGGQRQRLAIARETDQLRPTAHLRALSFFPLLDLAPGALVDGVVDADRIFVFDTGRIVEQGRHDELVAMGGIYAAMVATQELD